MRCCVRPCSALTVCWEAVLTRTVAPSQDSPTTVREPSWLAALGGAHLLVHGLLPCNVGLLRGRQRCVLAGEGAHETLKMKQTPHEGTLYANTGRGGGASDSENQTPASEESVTVGKGVVDRTGGLPSAPPASFPCGHPPAVSHLHAVRLVTHGHRLTPHVAHGAGLWRLGHGREALWGLGGHVLQREGYDGRRAAGPCPGREWPCLPT